MTTVEATTLSSRTVAGDAAARHTEGIPALFAALLLLAAVIVVAVLIAGPMIPALVSVPAALIALALVATGWIVAGPRL